MDLLGEVSHIGALAIRRTSDEGAVATLLRTAATSSIPSLQHRAPSTVDVFMVMKPMRQRDLLRAISGAFEAIMNQMAAFDRPKQSSLLKIPFSPSRPRSALR